jgi:hypothetical protein
LKTFCTESTWSYSHTISSHSTSTLSSPFHLTRDQLALYVYAILPLPLETQISSHSMSRLVCVTVVVVPAALVHVRLVCVTVVVVPAALVHVAGASPCTAVSWPWSVTSLLHFCGRVRISCSAPCPTLGVAMRSCSTVLTAASVLSRLIPDT